jgi:hypothetical protein
MFTIQVPQQERKAVNLVLEDVMVVLQRIYQLVLLARLDIILKLIQIILIDVLHALRTANNVLAQPYVQNVPLDIFHQVINQNARSNVATTA